MPKIAITVNGKAVQIDSVLTVKQLLDTVEVPPNYLAVEVNEQVIPREDYAKVTVDQGDRIEVVTLVGGG